MLDRLRTYQFDVLNSHFRQVIDGPQKARNKTLATKTNSGTRSEEEEQEWGGINDTPEGKTKQKAKRKQRKRKEKRHAAAEAAAPQTLPENSFDILPDEDEDGKASAGPGVRSLF